MRKVDPVRRSRLMIMVVFSVLGIALAGQPATAAPPPNPATTAHVRAACDTKPGPRRVHCLALLRTAADGTPLSIHAASSSALPPGYGPAQLQAAYELVTAAASRGVDQTVALVDAFDAPNAEADLNKYRTTYGLPACTTENGCFRKVNQVGETSPLPQPDAGWAVEESLDLDMVSAVCPRCHIMLVESDDNQDVNLAASVATAAKLGATEISNSYGEPEYSGESSLEPFFDQPGVAITAAAGDGGYGVGYPASSASVTSVGGTTLWPAGGARGWTESTWGGSGSGCSTQIAKPAWQHDSCSHRSDNDLSAVADPDTPVAIYDSYGQGGWLRIGGTSASSPIVAAFYALVGKAAQQAPGGSYPYTHPKNFFDITSGTNASTPCSPAFLCTAGSGYDGPTGLGTPDFSGTGPGSGTCTNGWSVAPTPPDRSDTVPGLSTLSETTAVAALSPSNVWTAGFYYENKTLGPAGSTGALSDIEHWNGSKWERTPTPNPLAMQKGTIFVQPTSMSFDRPDDGWVTGFYADGEGRRPLVEHWNGKKWTLSPVLSPTGTVQVGTATITNYEYGEGISAVSPSDVWLTVSNVDKQSNRQGSALEHWDGHAWNYVAFPDQASATVTLQGVHALSATDAWVVGSDQRTPQTLLPIAMHWDGHAWSTTPMAVDSPVVAPKAVTGTSPDDVWAVGLSDDGDMTEPLIEHWDGHAWKNMPTTDAGSVASILTNLEDVTAISPNDVWAAGRYNTWDYLLEHWDGRSWTIVPPPAATRPNALWGISASAKDDVWAVGAQVVWNPTGQGVYNYAIRNVCRGG